MKTECQVQLYGRFRYCEKSIIPTLSSQCATLICSSFTALTAVTHFFFIHMHPQTVGRDLLRQKSVHGFRVSGSRSQAFVGQFGRRTVQTDGQKLHVATVECHTLLSCQFDPASWPQTTKLAHRFQRHNQIGRFRIVTKLWSAVGHVHTRSGHPLVSSARNFTRLQNLRSTGGRVEFGMHFCRNGHQSDAFSRRFGNRSIVSNLSNVGYAGRTIVARRKSVARLQGRLSQMEGPKSGPIIAHDGTGSHRLAGKNAGLLSQKADLSAKSALSSVL